MTERWTPTVGSEIAVRAKAEVMDGERVAAATLFSGVVYTTVAVYGRLDCAPWTSTEEREALDRLVEAWIEFRKTNAGRSALVHSDSSGMWAEAGDAAVAAVQKAREGKA